MSLLRFAPSSLLPRSLCLLLNPTAVAARLYTDWSTHSASNWESPEEVEQARSWVESFKVEDLPKKACRVTFSSSSGPGGQNVNKLSTKATLHFDLKSKACFLPGFVLRKIRENSNHMTNGDEVVLQADESRKQSDNLDEAYRRLHKIIVSAVSKDVPGVTSAEKKKHVAELQKRDEAARRKMKTIQSSKKDFRRGKSGGGLE